MGPNATSASSRPSREPQTRWCGVGARRTITPNAANGSPGLAFYKPSGGGLHKAYSIQVMEQSEGKIIGIHAFLDPRPFAVFGLPPTLAA
jgi:RNA polymerase sigma-70 factor (ECF subfamily)